MWKRYKEKKSGTIQEVKYQFQEQGVNRLLLIVGVSPLKEEDKKNIRNFKYKLEIEYEYKDIKKRK